MEVVVCFTQSVRLLSLLSKAVKPITPVLSNNTLHL